MAWIWCSLHGKALGWAAPVMALLPSQYWPCNCGPQNIHLCDLYKQHNPFSPSFYNRYQKQNQKRIYKHLRPPLFHSDTHSRVQARGRGLISFHVTSIYDNRYPLQLVSKKYFKRWSILSLAYSVRGWMLTGDRLKTQKCLLVNL